MKFDYDIVIKIVKELEIFEISSRKCECVVFSSRIGIQFISTQCREEILIRY